MHNFFFPQYICAIILMNIEKNSSFSQLITEIWRFFCGYFFKTSIILGNLFFRQKNQQNSTSTVELTIFLEDDLFLVHDLLCKYVTISLKISKIRDFLRLVVFKCAFFFFFFLLRKYAVITPNTVEDLYNAILYNARIHITQKFLSINNAFYNYRNIDSF